MLEICDINPYLCKVSLIKKSNKPYYNFTYKRCYTNKSLVLVDDVLNSGTP